MGVPAFFMWLSQRYPKIVSPVKETPPQEINGITLPIDATQPNPNDFEVDNLYLDLNGIVHPCCHPEDRDAPETEEDMMIEIFKYLDRIMSLVRPRKLLYIAIDGVAPRAKMNQQRSRRFRAGQESRLKKETNLESLENSGNQETEKEDENKSHFDSNCITPGTPFMDKLSNCLKFYIAERLNNEAAWKDLNVILSDASVPGEGEHKIMDYIRRMRNSPEHNPNTQHVLYGLDADLIMLSLATHEPRFKVLREDLTNKFLKICTKCTQPGHTIKNCPKSPDEIVALPDPTSVKPFVFLHVDILREYLEVELEVPGLNFPYCFENAIDDWIFLIFFVGNDFLPHLPFLSIHEGAIPKLIAMWKTSLNQMGGFITKDGEVNFKRFKTILDQLAQMEGQVFKTRSNKEARMNTQAAPEQTVEVPGQKRKIAAPSAAERALKKIRKDLNGIDPNKIKFHEDAQEVFFGKPGYEERYYVSKFGVKADDMEFRKNVARSYIEGLTWVLRYYYQGCCSWGWFYPYHYPPFASDFLRVDNLDFEFEMGEPLRPFEQLMGVLPVDSKSHLPEPLHFLMEDKESPIIDFYPLDFKLDMNGANKLWKALAILPFIEIDRLLRAINLVYPKLTPDEHRRNSFGQELMYIRETNRLEPQFKRLFIEELKEPIAIDPILSLGISGFIAKDPDCNPHGINRSPLVGKGPQDIMADLSLGARYSLPKFSQDFIFPTSLLSGATPSTPALNDGDKDAIRYGGTRNFGRHDYQRHEYYKGRENYENKTHHDLVQDGFISNDQAPSNYHNFYPQRGSGQRGGYQNQGQRGGYQGQAQRGGYQGQAQRGGYQNQGQRGGHQSQRGGYQNQQGGYPSHQAYPPQQGGYQNPPAYPPQSGGHQPQYGGYQGLRGVYEGHQNSQRGGYGSRGGHQAQGPYQPRSNAPPMIQSSRGRPGGPRPPFPTHSFQPRGGRGGYNS